MKLRPIFTPVAEPASPEAMTSPSLIAVRTSPTTSAILIVRRRCSRVPQKRSASRASSTLETPRPDVGGSMRPRFDEPSLWPAVDRFRALRSHRYRAGLGPLRKPPLLAGVRPEGDHRADQENESREPDQVDERLHEHLQVDRAHGVPFAELELVADHEEVLRA